MFATSSILSITKRINSRQGNTIPCRGIIHVTSEVMKILLYTEKIILVTAYSEFNLFRPQVLDAIANNRPVVALESTIISHGMPYPRNIEVACRVEAVIRSFGAIPATCAIINGELSTTSFISINARPHS